MRGTTEYKYSIRERMDALPEETRRQMKKELIAELAISRVHLNRIIAIQQGAKNEALPSQLQVIAQHLCCTIDDLLN
jgi:DNA-binding Xre family transcriptional regulator